MRILVNGKEHETAEGTTVTALLAELNVTGPVAVELNRTICPKTKHQETSLKSGDTLEVVTIVGGG